MHEVHELGCTKYRGTLLNKCCHLVNYGFCRASVPQKYHLSSLCYESLYESRRIFFFQMVAISFCQHKGKDEEGLFPSQCGGERTHERERHRKAKRQNEVQQIKARHRDVRKEEP